MRYKQINAAMMLCVDSGVQFPCANGNADYEAYRDWLAEGNTPEPADPPQQLSPQEQIDALEVQTMLPRVTREFMLTFMELNATPAQLAGNIGYTKVKALDDQIKNLRGQIK